MGIINAWRGLKTWRAVAQAANEAAGERSPAGSAAPPRGFASGLGNVIAQTMGPRMEARGEVRGDPLRGSEPAVVDGTAWRQPVTAQAALLRAGDAAFDVAALEDFAFQVAAAVSATWAGADPGGVRAVMSDALWEPFAAVVTMDNAINAKRAASSAARGAQPQGRHGNPLQEGQPAAARLTGLHVGGWYHSALVTVHVRLREDLLGRLAAMSAAERAQLDAEFKGAEYAEWDEDWLFQRSARPGGDPMIEPPACPACGASTRADGRGRCPHCQSLLPFLTTGWLATMIVSHHPMFARMRERYAQSVSEDPAEAMQRLEMLARVNPRMAEQVARQLGIDPRTLSGGPR